MTNNNKLHIHLFQLQPCIFWLSKFCFINGTALHTCCPEGSVKQKGSLQSSMPVVSLSDPPLQENPSSGDSSSPSQSAEPCTKYDKHSKCEFIFRQLEIFLSRSYSAPHTEANTHLAAHLLINKVMVIIMQAIAKLQKNMTHIEVFASKQIDLQRRDYDNSLLFSTYSLRMSWLNGSVICFQ